MGAGFIGVEIALLLADLGVAVTVVELRERVMPGMLDQETAELVRTVLVARGVRVRLGAEVTAFEGEARAEGVRLASGERVTADIYIAATGVKPTIDYLADRGSRRAGACRSTSTCVPTSRISSPPATWPRQRI